MLYLLRTLLCWTFRFLLWLRYRVRVEGLQKLRGRPGPFLIAPNHPAYIDPALVLSRLWPVVHPRPMLYESMFRTPTMRCIRKLLDATPIPDLDALNIEAQRQVREAVQSVIEGLHRGENHILWPAGHVQRDGLEHLGSASALTEILKGAPEATLVLVRTRGVFGSMTSYARTGQAPRLGERARAALGWLLANLLFFMPRRRVCITVEVVQRERLPPLERDAVNRWAEAWYNAEGPEPPTFVPYHGFLGPRSWNFPPPPSIEAVDLTRIKPETREAANQLILQKLKAVRPNATEDQLKPDVTLDQLGMNSLVRMDLQLAVERRFGFTADETPLTVGQVWALAQGIARKGPTRPPPPEWFRPPATREPVEIVGQTLAEAFVHRALRCLPDVAVADDLAGALTYERLLVGALTLARRFRKLESPHVGLLLPASVGADAALLGLLLAGKLPVILNWTTGPANLAHAARVMGLTHVVSSRAFVQRTAVEVAGTQYLHLEDVRQTIGRFELLRTLLLVRWLPGSVRKQVPIVPPESPAVVLFTSGSEKAPKAVPLTHANLLGNQRMLLQVVAGLNRHDSILGFLPPFHSFGLSVTGLFPLLSGIRVVRHPDPTDAAGLTRKIAGYRATLMAGTPTFFGYILDRAHPGELDSLRLIVLGAEKCPQAVFDATRRLAPHAEVLEGYGITECSPVVSVNPPGASRQGTVGKPLPGVEVQVVDVDTRQPLGPDHLGMLLVSGPTVFPGYIASEGEAPFLERDGKRWYVTGDLVSIDHDGYIHFRGRLKRFLKAGGEMISLPALEEPFAARYPPTKDGPRVAVEGVDEDGDHRIVLFTTEPISLQEANDLLLHEGFHGVMRLTEVRKLDKIPQLGTGKTDYKVLRAALTGQQPE